MGKKLEEAVEAKNASPKQPYDMHRLYADCTNLRKAKHAIYDWMGCVYKIDVWSICRAFICIALIQQTQRYRMVSTEYMPRLQSQAAPPQTNPDPVPRREAKPADWPVLLWLMVLPV